MNQDFSSGNPFNFQSTLAAPSGGSREDALLAKFVYTVCWASNLMPDGNNWEWAHPIEAHWNLLGRCGLPHYLWALRAIIPEDLWRSVTGLAAAQPILQQGREDWITQPGLDQLPVTLVDLDQVRVPWFDTPGAPASDFDTVREAINNLAARGIRLWRETVSTARTRAPAQATARRFDATRVVHGPRRARQILRERAAAAGRPFERTWDTSGSSSGSETPAQQAITAETPLQDIPLHIPNEPPEQGIPHLVTPAPPPAALPGVPVGPAVPPPTTLRTAAASSTDAPRFFDC